MAAGTAAPQEDKVCLVRYTQMAAGTAAPQEDRVFLRHTQMAAGTAAPQEDKVCLVRYTQMAAGTAAPQGDKELPCEAPKWQPGRLPHKRAGIAF